MFERVISRFGRLDLLVNNAGVQTWKPLLEVTEEEWDLVVDTNLKGCFLCTQQAARYMKDHGGGAIVNLGSGCNKLAFPVLVAYTASKGGIEMFTKEAAVELGQYGIRVNCIAPGSIESERTEPRIRTTRAHGPSSLPWGASAGPQNRSDGGLSGQQGSIVHQRTNHLDRWSPIHQGAMAIYEVRSGNEHEMRFCVGTASPACRRAQLDRLGDPSGTNPFLVVHFPA